LRDQAIAQISRSNCSSDALFRMSLLSCFFYLKLQQSLRKIKIATYSAYLFFRFELSLFYLRSLYL